MVKNDRIQVLIVDLSVTGEGIGKTYGSIWFKIYGNITRIGGFKDVSMLPIMGLDESWRYRNKARRRQRKSMEWRSFLRRLMMLGRMQG